MAIDGDFRAIGPVKAFFPLRRLVSLFKIPVHPSTHLISFGRVAYVTLIVCPTSGKCGLSWVSGFFLCSYLLGFRSRDILGRISYPSLGDP